MAVNELLTNADGGAGEEPVTSLNSYPSYIVAANNHAVANNDMSMFDKASNFTAAALMSGTASIANTGIAIMNTISDEQTKKIEVTDWMKSYDDNLPKYYEDNKETIDLVGDIAVGLIPGTVGVKAYNWGFKAWNMARYGEMGINMEKATGLLGGMQQVLLKEATTKAAQTSGIYSYLSKEYIGATLSGVGEQVIQNAVFGTAAAATMFKSPLLDDKDLSEIRSNIIDGALLGGALGGAVEAVVGRYAIGKVLSERDKDLLPLSHINELSTSDAWQRIGGYLHSKQVIESVSEEQMTQLTEKYGNIPANLKERNINRINDKIRIELQSMGGKDATSVNLFADDIMSDFSFNGVMDNGVFGLKGIGRVLDSHPAEKEVLAVRAKINAGKQLAREEYDALDATTTSYKYLRGARAGDSTTELPTRLGIADILKPGQEIKITTRGLSAGDTRYDFSKAHYNVLDMLPMEAEAYHIWLHYQPALPESSIIKWSDTPRMGKIIKDMKAANIDDTTATKYRFIMEDGSELTGLTKPKIMELMQNHNDDIKDRLLQGSANNEKVTDMFAAANRLRMLTGIQFALGDSSKVFNDGLAYGWNSSRASQHTELAGQITLDYNLNKGRSWVDVIQTLKHEEGHTQWNMVSKMNTIPQSEMPTLLREMEAVSRRARQDAWKNADKSKDYAYLRDPNELAADTYAYLSFHPNDKAVKLAPTFMKYLAPTTRPLDKSVLDALAIKAAKLTDEDVATMLNMKIGRVTGDAVDKAGATNDYFAMEHYAEQYAQRVSGQGGKLAISPDQIMLQPSVIKLVHDNKALAGRDQFLIDGITDLRQREKIWRQQSETTLTSVIPEHYNKQLPMDDDSFIRSVSGQGAGMKIIAGANGEYSSAESVFQWVGKVTNMWKTESSKLVEDTLGGLRNKMAGNMKDWMEISAIERIITSTKERYIFDEAGEHLILKGQSDYLDAIKAGKQANAYQKLATDAPDTIEIKSDLVREFLKEHIGLNAKRLDSSAKMSNIMHGTNSTIDPRVLYFPQRDPKDFPFKAFVRDTSVNSLGHVSMLHAKDAATLQAMIDKIPTGQNFDIIHQPADITVRTKPEVERWHRAIGDFKRSEVLGDNYIDTALMRSGAGSSYLPYSDDKAMFTALFDWHKQQEHNVVREAIGMKYAKTFAELKHMDEQFTDVANARVGYASISPYAAERTSSPYMSYIRMAMDIPNVDAVPARAFQGWLDKQVTHAWNTIANATAKTSSVEQMDKVNGMLDSFGIKPFDYDAATQALANQAVDRGALSTFTRRSQAILSSISLGLDSLTGVTNTIGSAVITCPELKLITDRLKSNPEAMGKLGEIISSKIPETERSMLTPMKLISEGIKDFWNPEIRAWAKANGFSSRHLDEVMSAYDEFSIPEIYTTADLNSKLTNGYNKTMKLLDKGSGWFKTKLMEEFQRVTAAASMKRITDLAVQTGEMSEAEALTYINTFVNRVQGNYLASQRAGVFHGPVGQAVGLFQTYNFNFMQQMFRHIGEGNNKSAAMMMGLQGSIFGMSGLPAFQAINTHLIGGAEGNPEHIDVYKAMYNAVPKEVADWAMYGALSNTLGLFNPDLKMNLYTRGDINPRHITIIPTSFNDLPIVNASSRFFGNLLDTASKAFAGGDIATTLIQGLEHNSVNRPLSGVAVALSALTNPELIAYSTSNTGNLIASNDLMSMASLARIAGAKPLDEAKVSDWAFRDMAYKAIDKTRRDKLGEVMRSKLMSGEEFDDTTRDEFLHRYVRAGGKQEGFNGFMSGIFTSATVPQANKLAAIMSDYNAQTMQRMLGGRWIEAADRMTEEAQ